MAAATFSLSCGYTTGRKGLWRPQVVSLAALILLLYQPNGVPTGQLTLGPRHVLFVDSDVSSPWRVELRLKVFIGDGRYFASCVTRDMDDGIFGSSV